MDFSIIIVTYNSSDVIDKCVQSLLKMTGPSFEIIIVDNQSRDNTLEVLKQFGDNIKVIKSPSNDGYGAGVNIGFNDSSGQLIYTLNPDTIVINQDSLEKIQHYMNANPQHGLVATACLSDKKIYELNVAHSYPEENLLKHKLPDLPGKIAWTYGASMIVRRDVFEKINGFDEDYFVYVEDTDIGIRVRKAGFSIGFIEDVLVDHVGGSTINPSIQYSAGKMRLQSILKFYEKHYHPEDAKAIVSKMNRKARVNLAFHSIRRLLVPTRNTKYRYEKYKTIHTLSTDFLNKAETESS